MQTITVNTANHLPPTRSHPTASSYPAAKSTHHHPTKPAPKGNTNADLTFIGTATTLLRFGSLTILTDPNFLHAGDHVHLGPGVSATRVTNPAIDLHELPNIDLVLLSHYHADHFDQEVEQELRRDLPIITTPHAKKCLVDQKEDGEKFEAVTALDTWESLEVHAQDNDKGTETFVTVTAMPGKHVPPGILDKANDIVKAVFVVYIFSEPTTYET